MNPIRFDRISRLFADRRRQADTASSATPDALHADEAATDEKTSYLFVQSFQSGTLTPNANNDRHTLTLEQGLGQTVYFADRPSRDVGVTPTGSFLDVLGFPPDNPPNAALVVDTGNGETEIAVLELFDPTYDTDTQTATYEVRPLEAWDSSEGLNFHKAPSDLSTLSGELGTSHLFIDDCPNDTISCIAPYYGYQTQTVGTFENQGFCYDYLLCIPCEPFQHDPPYRSAVVEYWSDKCNNTYAACNGQCTGDFTNRCVLAGC